MSLIKTASQWSKSGRATDSQNEKDLVPTASKIELIQRLSDCGLPVVEATSFVSPKWVPQLADAAEVLAGLDLDSTTRHPVLVPNEKGLDRAMESGAREIAVFAAASESFSQKNTNCSIAGSLERIRPVVERAKENDIPVRGYISCVLGCPYEGDIEPEAVMLVAVGLNELGCYEISLGDTIGVGTPMKARALIEEVASQVPMSHLAVHFHDTYGAGIGKYSGLPRDRHPNHRLIGCRPGRLPVCQWRHRQCRQRGRGLYAGGPWF